MKLLTKILQCTMKDNIQIDFRE